MKNNTTVLLEFADYPIYKGAKPTPTNNTNMRSEEYEDASTAFVKEVFTTSILATVETEEHLCYPV